MHPTWEYRLWSENNLPPLRNRDHFDRIKEYCGKADILRIELLYNYGGIYIDADCECLRPLDEDLRRHKFFVCYENEEERKGLISNTVFGSRRHHPVLRHVMKSIKEVRHLNAQPVWTVVGPILLTYAVEAHMKDHSDIAILPTHAFLPTYHDGTRYEGNGKVYAEHHWYSTHERQTRGQAPRERHVWRTANP